MTLHATDLEHALTAATTALADRLNETGWISALTALAEAVGRIADALKGIDETLSHLETIGQALTTVAEDGVECTMREEEPGDQDHPEAS